MLGNQPRADKGISIDILMQKLNSIRTFILGNTNNQRKPKQKKARTVCWQMGKDWEVNGFGEGCPVLECSTSGWTPVLKGTM